MALVRIALHQLNPTVGALADNEALIAAGIDEARAAGAQLVVFPELAICGYPPEDLLLKAHFLEDCRAAIDRLALHATGIVALVGFPEHGADAFNAVAVLADGAFQGSYHKMELPNYGVFDELRYFQAGDRPALLEVDGVTLGLTVCEDDWVPDGPATDAALAGAELIVNLSASPYHAQKPADREQMFAQRARDHLCAYAFCAQVGGQDELVFDGSSAVCDHDGTGLARAPQFRSHMLLADIDPEVVRAARLSDTRPRAARRHEEELAEPRHLGSFVTAAGRDAPAHLVAELAARPGADQEVYDALVCGTRDYIGKNGFEHVVLGVSGGIDSALVLAIAVDALGADRVTAVVMPSRYSSTGTQDDARAIAHNLGTQVIEIPIGPALDAYAEMLAGPTGGGPAGLTEENLQSRIRGNLLMALSNTYGWLVLTTGNKSELSVGYSTLYGDSAGGFAVIKDVPKTLVYRLTALRAARGDDAIPPAILTRPPSAELRPDQKDSDSLPDYDTLDAILQGYVEDDLGREQLLAKGLPQDAVDRTIRLVDLAEYKRRQNPPGIKVTSKAFGRDRRMPITNRYGG